MVLQGINAIHWPAGLQQHEDEFLCHPAHLPPARRKENRTVLIFQLDPNVEGYFDISEEDPIFLLSMLPSRDGYRQIVQKFDKIVLGTAPVRGPSNIDYLWL